MNEAEIRELMQETYDLVPVTEDAEEAADLLGAACRMRNVLKILSGCET